ncbi:YqiA/YcfP family alpha/beta fold hydrolase [Crocosphaera sp.]|uniref:YqiA/YcfP family alpha/beta fold hydrolase n=1 Tax=Crocosphaera sp. TaxID=2729996 RepID=UPI002628F6E8|nr:YqiA/YcfP family alpha/beta fold hydrolase [Crocosphaera sp.]MDJ0580303.1 YqiA/YcfP family alpha/beta fold hydrolase [Crocosphaera sp.]
MLNNQLNYIYLHGFASSSQSLKAQKFKKLFASKNISLIIPDLNQNDFYNLTLTRQIEQISSYIENTPNSVVLVGSSLGALVSAFAAEKQEKVKGIILLAPAFYFFSHWLESLDKATLNTWKSQGELSIYHYGYKQESLLSYQFIIDGKNYDETVLKRPVPTLIFHGKNDEVIPIKSSYNYAQNRKWVKLIELDSDHSLNDIIPDIWRDIQDYGELRV